MKQRQDDPGRDGLFAGRVVNSAITCGALLRCRLRYSFAVFHIRLSPFLAGALHRIHTWAPCRDFYPLGLAMAFTDPETREQSFHTMPAQCHDKFWLNDHYLALQIW